MISRYILNVDISIRRRALCGTGEIRTLLYSTTVSYQVATVSELQDCAIHLGVMGTIVSDLETDTKVAILSMKRNEALVIVPRRVTSQST
jgi:hypothetical protein